MIPVNRFVHPLATSAWESAPASPVRLHTRASWVAGAAGDTDRPERSIVHSRVMFTDTPATLNRVSVGMAPGYHKCASGQERDAIVDLSLYAPNSSGWEEIGHLTAPRDSVLTQDASIELAGLRTTAFVARANQAAVDGWWPSWNLVSNGIHLDADVDPMWTPQPEGHLEVTSCDISNLPAGVEATMSQTEVRYRTPYLAVGFRIRSPAWSFLSLDADGDGHVYRNLLQMPRSMDIVRSGVYPSGVYPVLRDQHAEYLAQGPRFTSTTGDMPMGFLRSDYVGSTLIRGNTIRYDVDCPRAGQRYILEFRVERDRISVAIERSAAEDRRAWHSSAWHVALDNRVTPSVALGQVTHVGETGIMSGPVTWHFPRYGTIRILGTGSLVRSDSVRPLDTNTLELKVGEIPTDFGDYLLPGGRHQASLELVVTTPSLAQLHPNTPPTVRRAVERHTLTALSFRADTDTYSNNGASMHCTTSLQDASAIAQHLRDADGITPMKWIGDSLQRWLDGAPSYGSGATSQGQYRLDDEYVHLTANTLTAAARYAAHDPEWFVRNRVRLIEEIVRMLNRDVDGDGLVESSIRLGISGEHQWSTAWADVISFGWKDAWANAVAFDMWQLWITVLRASGEEELADRVQRSSELLQQNYLPTFLSPDTGIVAGWRSKDGLLHDYGFSVVNGAACASDLLPVATAREIMDRLMLAWDAVGLTDFRNGVPLNLWRIPETDLGGVVFGLPMGCYQQGGYSHHGARVIVDALHRVGLGEKGQAVLENLATTIADDTSFGGVGSGVDWRMADGTPSGYEGQLIEGFSILASALRYYGIPEPVGHG